MSRRRQRNGNKTLRLEPCSANRRKRNPGDQPRGYATLDGAGAAYQIDAGTLVLLAVITRALVVGFLPRVKKSLATVVCFFGGDMVVG